VGPQRADDWHDTKKNVEKRGYHQDGRQRGDRMPGRLLHPAVIVTSHASVWARGGVNPLYEAMPEHQEPEHQTEERSGKYL
jgi:hypothetical protein